MMMATKKSAVRRGKLTKADFDAAAALTKLFEKSPLKQKEIAALYGKNASGKTVSQGAMSQYKNATIKLGVVATLKFAKIFDVKPTEIRPDFQYRHLLASELPPRVQRMAAELAMYSDEVLDDIEESIKMLRTMGPGYQDLLRKLRENTAVAPTTSDE